MKTLKIAGMLLTIATMLALFGPSARAFDTYSLESRISFSGSVQIPGNKVLPAGTYWFIVPDPIGAPNNVAIYTADKHHLVAQLATRTVWRSFTGQVASTRTADTQIVLAQTSDMPALVSWFYPGNPDGRAFIYSTRQQRSIDEDAKESLLAGKHHSTEAPPDRNSGNLGNS